MMRHPRAGDDAMATAADYRKLAEESSSGRANPPTRACANTMPTWAGFGLSVLRGLNFGLVQSRRQNQKQRRK